MGCHKTLKRLTSLLCAVSLLLSLIGIPTFAVTAHAVTATTNQTVRQGNTAQCYVYINSTESLAALDVTVHFDPEKVKINSVNNSISCNVYDSAIKDSSIQFSYILDGVGTAAKTQLFSFTYQVLNDAEVGGAYFDITIGEAYDKELQDVSVSGSRCNFVIEKVAAEKYCAIYSTSSVSTAIAEEFTLNYRFSTNQIASGSVEIRYDPELFEVVDVDPGPFLTDKFCDINQKLPGSIYLSFMDTKYGNETFLLSVKFRTLKNVTETAKITFIASELCDLQLNNLICSGYTTTISVTYDESYVGDAPTMGVSASYDAQTEQVTAEIRLDNKSRLGAGDFVLLFDPAMLKLVSYEKGFAPNFFNVNDKEAADGVLKFSIISLSDIMTEETVMTLVFDAIRTCTDQTAVLDFSGSMITDAMTKPILLNFVNGSATIPEIHVYAGECDTKCNLCNHTRITDIPHVFDDIQDTGCNHCDHIRAVESITITSLPTVKTYLEGKDLLNVAGGKIKLFYDDGTSGEINMTADMISGFDNTVVGQRELTVRYGGGNANFTVEITAKSLSSIQVHTMPTKTKYLEAYDALDLFGGKLLLTYNNGTTDVINLSYAEVTGFDNTRVGEQTLTVRYGGKETTFKVDIIAKTMTELALEYYPDKTTYLEGAALDLTGMRIVAYYDNETSEEITDYTVSGYDPTPGTKDIVVSYGGHQVQFSVWVRERSLTRIAVTRLPDKMTYLEGQEIDFTGMEITAYYDNGTSEIVTHDGYTGYYTWPGYHYVQVYYCGWVAGFDVMVEEKSVSDLELVQLPYTTTYIQGQDVDLTGLLVKVYYNNGTTDYLEYPSVSGYDSYEVGIQTLTVEHEWYQVEFQVEVIPKVVTYLSIVQFPFEQSYLEGEEFDSSGLVVGAYYNDGSYNEDVFYELSGYDPTPGYKTITVSCGGQTESFEVYVQPKSLEYIEITSYPNTTILEGKPFYPTGLEITAYYNNGTSEVVTDYELYGYSDYPGVHWITIEYGGQSTGFWVTVRNKSIVSIEITQMPDNLTCTEGVPFDSTGLVVTAYYDNDTSERVWNYELYGNTDSVGVQIFTVTYRGESAYFHVNVEQKVLSSIDINTLPHTMHYVEGMYFDSNGLSLQLYYNNGTEETIWSGWSEEYDFSTSGTKTVILSYEGHTTELSGIMVDDRRLERLILRREPERREYIEGQMFDSNGMMIRAEYNDGSYEVLLSGWYIEGYDPYTIGDQVLTIHYGGATLELEVYVFPKQVVSLTIARTPDRMDYVEGQDLDLSGLVVWAGYNDGTTETITDYTVSGYDSEPGQKRIEIGYGGHYDYFYVSVANKTITHISIQTPPKKTSYVEGESFDPEGLTVIAHYNNGTSEEIGGYTLRGYDATPGKKTINVDNGEYIATFTVTVNRKSLTGIAIEMSGRVDYLEGEALDTEGMIVRAYYNNGTSELIRDYTVSGYDSTPGEKTVVVSYGGKTASYSVSVTAKKLTGIEISTLPAKRSYLEGEKLNLTGLVVKANYNNGTSAVIQNYRVLGYDTTPGTKRIKISYENYDIYFDVEVRAKSLDKISFDALPKKLIYLEGDKLDLDGLVVKASYNNGTSAVITDYAVSGYSSTPGTKTITVTYGDKTEKFNVTVNAKLLTGISIATKPKKLTYLEGDKLNLDGLVVKAGYNNGTSANVTDYVVSGYSSTPGKKTITVSYGGKTATFEVTVNAKTLSGISITSKPQKLTYLEGDKEDLTGLVVKANYNNGTSAIVTDYTVSGYSSTPGKKTITVSYGGKTATFEVTVNAKTLTGISITSKPKKLTYIQGEKLDLAGLVVKASYNNSTSANVTDYAVSGFDTNKVGQQTVKVTYGGKEATFAVTVESAVPDTITSDKHTVSDGYMRKVSTGTSVTELTAGINEKEHVKVFRGDQEVSGDAVIGTGMVIKIMDGNTVKATVTVVVTGDTNGDGKSTVTDMLAIKSHLLKKSGLAGASAQAADTSKDGGISITDFIQIKASILGKGTIIPN